MTSIQKKLFELQDKDYASFQAKLTPTVKPEFFIGVRVPLCRTLAKELYKNNNAEVKKFLLELPHKYYDENMLHSVLLSYIKDYDTCLEYVNAFLPYIDNWAVCDILSPKVFKKNKALLIKEINKWTKSKHVYTARFGVEMLMSHYLDEDFKKEYLDIPLNVKLDDYYAKMMLAWFYATALAKKWEETIIYLEEKRLDPWTHNKTIQKAIESYRINDLQKEYLRKLKV